MGENIQLMLNVLTQANILQLYRYVESVRAKGVVCDICTQLQDKFAIIHPSPYPLPHLPPSLPPFAPGTSFVCSTVSAHAPPPPHMYRVVQVSR